ncbi:MAG: hypothetical protein LBP76_00765 [Treponema sp.]|nr:hypothetical protein [Treponema sp.]
MEWHYPARLKNGTLCRGQGTRKPAADYADRTPNKVFREHLFVLQT